MIARLAIRIVAAALASALLLAGSAGAQTTSGKPGAARAAKGAASRATTAPAAPDLIATHGPRFASLCAACHGPNGRSDTAGTPVLAGQHGFYAITQLFLFREGRRSNDAMTAVARTMSDDDLRGFAAVIDALPAVPAPPPPSPPDPSRMAKGRELAVQHKCAFCHGEDLSGGQQVPRIGGQREDYMRDTLHDFKSGKRPGYTQAMGAAVSQVPVEDLETLAWYAARVPVASTTSTAASAPTVKR